MRRITAFAVIMSVVAAMPSAFANPLPVVSIEVVKAFPPEITVEFNIPFDISGDTIHTSGGYAVIDSGVFGDYHDVIILDSLNTSGFILNPEGDAVMLTSEEEFIDMMNYGTLGHAPPPILGHYILTDLYLPPDDWEYMNVWIFDFADPGWGRTEIFINEISAHASWEVGSGFIELYNSSDTAISLSGWSIVCDTICTISADAIVFPGGLYVLDEPAFPSGFDMDWDADNIYLISADSQLVDQVGWSSDHGENVSFMRYPDGDVDATYWYYSFWGYNDGTSSHTFENGFPSRGAPNRHDSPGFVVIGTRAIGGEAWVDLHWTNPIWEPQFDISVAVRSETGFPETPDDGIMIYEGDAQHVTDTEDLFPGIWYYYTVFARNDGGEYSVPTYESRDSVMLSGVRVTEDVELPQRISYLKSYPNPFNALTTLQYDLLQSSGITIEICNIVGQRVATLFEGIQQAGEHTLTWDASGFPSGVYFARLEAGKDSESIKVVLLK